ncbi:MAG: ankyrin repeat domain-containing protein [Planctomycetes bacterium]|nr:ankyrin repeat domain-containing protein [Planctomycetota bacterium]
MWTKGHGQTRKEPWSEQRMTSEGMRHEQRVLAPRNITGHQIANLELRRSWYWAVGLLCLLAGCSGGPKEPRDYLQKAARAGNLEGVRSLIKGGADVNSRTWEGVTALHEAARGAHQEIVELLIIKGADVNAKTKSGHTPLHDATNRDIAELLLTRGADVNSRANQGSTPLYDACRAGDEGLVNLLITHGADVNIGTEDGTTPLYEAAVGGDEGIIRLLLAKGAHVNATATTEPALYAAAQGGHPPVAEYSEA